MRTLTLLHRIAGLAVAVPLALTALSGALLLARDPWYRAQFPSLAAPSTADIARQAAVLTAIDAAFVPARPRVVKFPRDGFNAYHVYLTDDSEALVDAATGMALDRWRWNERVMPFLFELHAHLLAGDTGKTLNGIAACGAVLLACSGVIAWLPRRRVMPLRRVVPSRVGPGDLLRSHAATGAIAGIPLLLFAVTGAGIVFYAPVSTAASRLLDHRPPAQPSVVIEPGSHARRPWIDLLGATRTAFPETGPAMVYPGTARNAAVTFRLRLPGEWHPNGRSYVLVNPYDGTVAQAIDARAQGIGTRAMHALYPLHAARVGGWWLIAAGAFTGIALGWLAVGGAWTYVWRAVVPLAIVRTPRMTGETETTNGRAAANLRAAGQRTATGSSRSAADSSRYRPIASSSDGNSSARSEPSAL